MKITQGLFILHTYNYLKAKKLNWMLKKNTSDELPNATHLSGLLNRIMLLKNLYTCACTFSNFKNLQTFPPAL